MIAGSYLSQADMKRASEQALENKLNRASEANKAYLNEAKELYQPYAESGLSSLDEYMKLLMGGVDSLSGDQNLKNMQDMAEKKIMANRATSGLLRSGGTASALNDSLLNFTNNYYNNRLGQFQQGAEMGYKATGAQSSILEKLGGNETDLASALANIQMQREANEATVQAAREQAAAAKAAAKSSSKSSLLGSIIGAAGTALGAYFGGPVGAAAGSTFARGMTE